MSEAPHNLEAEYDILGAAMMSPAAAVLVSEMSMDDFYRASNGEIWSAIAWLSREGQPVDIVTVKQRLKNRKKLDAGMDQRLREILSLTVASANVSHYIQIVKDCALRRRLLYALLQAQEAVLDGQPFAEAARILEGVEQPPDASKARWLLDLVQEFEEDVRNPPDMSQVGVPAPLALKPWMPGRLTILGGYQGDGKTAFAMQCAEAAARVGKKVGVASLEMTDRDLVDRIIAMRGLDYMQVQERRFLPAEREKVNQVMAEVAIWPIMVWDDATMTVDQIVDWQRANKFDLLIVDHLHQFDWNGERHILESIVKKFVALSKSESVPVLLLAQLKRPWKTDKAPPPTMSMLRESGMIEALAAQVTFIYRPRNEFGLRDHKAKLLCVKNRFGAEFNHDLFFVADNVYFTELQSW